jgi:hypothetical protein
VGIAQQVHQAQGLGDGHLCSNNDGPGRSMRLEKRGLTSFDLVVRQPTTHILPCPILLPGYLIDAVFREQNMHKTLGQRALVPYGGADPRQNTIHSGDHTSKLHDCRGHVVDRPVSTGSIRELVCVSLLAA